MRRGIRQSKMDPNKYYFSRDVRVRITDIVCMTQDVINELTSHITCPFLFVKAKQSAFANNPLYYEETAEFMLRHNKLFQKIEIDGTHHAHLNNPTRVSGACSEFIRKHRLSGSTLETVKSKV